MRLFRFCRLPLQAFAILIGRLPVFVRLAWVCIVVSLISGAVSDRHAVAGGIVDLLARGVFAVAWLRLIALGELPAGPGYFRLGRREIFTAAGWTLAEIFIVMPAQVLAASLAMATGGELSDIVMVTLGLSHLLLGAVFLMPAEAALENTAAKVAWRLPDLVMRGGLAVSMAVFLAWLPVNFAMAVVTELSGTAAAQGIGLPHAAATILRYLGIALTAGTLALVWNALEAEGEER